VRERKAAFGETYHSLASGQLLPKIASRYESISYEADWCGRCGDGGSSNTLPA
jgi:hypothetical protein